MRAVLGFILIILSSFVSTYTAVFSDAYPALDFVQASGAGPTASGAFRFSIYESPAGNVGVSSPGGILESPNASTSFSSLEELQAAYPPGVYTSTYDQLFGQGTISLQATVPSAPAFDVPTPTILNSTWADGKLRLTPGDELSIAPWEDRPAASLIHLALKSGSTTLAFYSLANSTKDLASQTAFLQNNLLPGAEYQGTIWFAALSDQASTMVDGGFTDFFFQSGSGRATSFTLVAVPEPAEWGALFAAGLLGFALISRRRKMLLNKRITR
jgi:hypothetical protein